jgi:hypothetical protein
MLMNVVTALFTLIDKCLEFCPTNQKQAIDRNKQKSANK